MAVNNSTNGSYEYYYEEYYYGEDDCSMDGIPEKEKDVMKAATSLLWILVVVIAALNVYVLVVLCRRKGKRSRLHYFIFHLAIADLLVGLISVLEDAVERSVGQWLAGEVICKITKTIIYVPFYASNNLLISLSIDRFIAVAFPLKFVKIGTKIDKTLIGCAWVAAIILTAPGLIIYEVSECLDCDLYYLVRMNTQEIYFILMLLLVYAIPFVILSALYIAITYIIWKAYRTGVNMKCSGSLTATGEGRGTAGKPMLNPKLSRQESASGVLPKAKIRSVKMTLVICVAFLVCWGPYFILNALVIYNIISIPPPGTFEMVQVMYAFNSVVNPVIFILFNTKLFCKRKQSDDSADDDNADKVTTKSTRLQTTFRLPKNRVT